MLLKIIKINQYQVGLRFRNEKLVEALQPGWYLAKGFLGERIDILSEKDLCVSHPELDEIIRCGVLSKFIEVVDLKDNERALLWVEGRFEKILTPGKHGIWKNLREIQIERLSAEDPQFKHKLLYRIAQSPESEEATRNTAPGALRTMLVEPTETCLYFKDGKLAGELTPGFHAFWKGIGTLKFLKFDLREKLLDMAGQEIITADKVTLRLNAVVSYRISDAKKSMQITDAPDQALYREGQLLLRAAIGGRSLDEILGDKAALTDGIADLLKAKADKFGLSIVSFGIRDIILPGDIRELMNRVVAAQKEAEANQIVRREETAATRSQCNTAKILEANPVLMRLRELEVLERVAKDSKLSLILGEKGLTEKIVNML